MSKLAHAGESSTASPGAPAPPRARPPPRTDLRPARPGPDRPGPPPRSAPPRRTPPPRSRARRSSGSSAVYGSPLCRPPSSSTVGRSMLRSATRVEAMFVALESLIQSTPSTLAHGLQPVLGASKLRSPRAIASAPTPASRAAIAAASAFARLCSPRIRSSVAVHAAAPRPPPVRAPSSPPRSTQPPRSRRRRRAAHAEQVARARRIARQPQHRCVLAVQHPAALARSRCEELRLVRVVGLDRVVPVQVIRRQVGHHADARARRSRCPRAGTSSSRPPRSPARAARTRDLRRARAPMLPAAGASSPASRSRCAVSAVTVRLAVRARHRDDRRTQVPKRELQLGDPAHAARRAVRAGSARSAGCPG